MLTATECTGSVAVIQVQGTSDPVVPFGLAQQSSQFWSRYNGLGENATEPGAHSSCMQYPSTDGIVDPADTTAAFTVRFPDELPSTPVQGAVVVYAGEDVTPTTAPLAFMTLQFAPGTVSPGEEVTYTTQVAYSAFGAGGFEMPGRYTVMVTMHTENGGYPIPVPGVDKWTMTTHEFTEKSAPVVRDGVLQLEPIAAETGL